MTPLMEYNLAQTTECRFLSQKYNQVLFFELVLVEYETTKIGHTLEKFSKIKVIKESILLIQYSDGNFSDK